MNLFDFLDKHPWEAFFLGVFVVVPSFGCLAAAFGEVIRISIGCRCKKKSDEE